MVHSTMMSEQQELFEVGSSNVGHISGSKIPNEITSLCLSTYNLWDGMMVEKKISWCGDGR